MSLYDELIHEGVEKGKIEGKIEGKEEVILNAFDKGYKIDDLVII